MGAINYKTSDFITIGYNGNCIDYEDEYYYYEGIQDYYDQIAHILANKYYFHYFSVALKPGYYEGFTIDIEFNYSYCFDNYEDKRNAQKEITQIRRFLYECCSDYECCSVYPGWVTTYRNYENSLQDIDAAVKEMRDTVKNTPTWATLPRNEKSA